MAEVARIHPVALACLRLRRNLTQAQLAEQLGVDLTSVKRWEQGRRGVGHDLMVSWLGPAVALVNTPADDSTELLWTIGTWYSKSLVSLTHDREHRLLVSSDPGAVDGVASVLVSAGFEGATMLPARAAFIEHVALGHEPVVLSPTPTDESRTRLGGWIASVLARGPGRG